MTGNNPIIANRQSVAQRVAKLPDITGPGKFGQNLHGAVIDLQLVGTAFRLKDQHIIDQTHNIRTLPQRRQLEGYPVEAIIKIFPEFTAGHHVQDISVSGADHVQIYWNRRLAPQWRNLALRQDPQQPWLQTGGHISDFIEEQSAAVRLQNLASHPLAARTGKGTVFIPEEFALYQRFRDGCTVYRHKWFFRSPTGIVDRLGKHFLAGPRLSIEKNRYGFVHDTLDALHAFFKLTIRTCQVIETQWLAGARELSLLRRCFGNTADRFKGNRLRRTQRGKHLKPRPLGANG